MITLQWDGIESAVANLLKYETDQKSRLRLACEEIAQLLEHYAIMNHLWEVDTQLTNVTTRGTWGEVAKDMYDVVLSAGAWYDVYLELSGPNRGNYASNLASLPHMAIAASGGKFAWLWPAMVANHQAIMDTFARHLSH